MEFAVECRQLKKQYGTDDPVHALKGVDLCIRKGEVFLLVGPSGCGKTTLISIISGILKQSSGDCLLLSKNVSEFSEEEKIKFRSEHIGFVFQSYQLLPALTCEENVAIPLMIQGKTGLIPYEPAQVLARVGLKGKERQLPAQLSGGQQQRVAIARALVHRPDILVCDEPTSALDHQSGQKVMEFMTSLAKERGLTLIVVTHDNRIFHFADRIGVMDDGCVTQVIDDPKTWIGAHG